MSVRSDIALASKCVAAGLVGALLLGIQSAAGAGVSRLLDGAAQLISTHPGSEQQVQTADRQEVASAGARRLDHLLEELPDDTTVSWQNSDTNTRYQFRVHQSFDLSVGDRCRAFTLSTWEEERFSQAFRTACRDRAGQWSLIFGD